MKHQMTGKMICTLLLIVLLLSLVACGGYEVSLGIGDGSKENDAVRVEYKIAETLTDGYVLKGSFTAESEADIDRTFVFALSSADPILASDYTEQVLFSVKGSEIAATRKADGTYGKVAFQIEFTKLSNYFAETETETNVYLVFHEDGAERSDITRWGSSAYQYTFTGGKVKLTK